MKGTFTRASRSGVPFIRAASSSVVADSLGGIAFPHAKLALRVHRRRQQNGKKQTRETVYAVTSLDAHQASPAELATAIRGHWNVEAHHHIRDRTFAEDASTIHTGTAPRAIRDAPQHALWIWCITDSPLLPGT